MIAAIAFLIAAVPACICLVCMTALSGAGSVAPVDARVINPYTREVRRMTREERLWARAHRGNHVGGARYTFLPTQMNPVDAGPSSAGAAGAAGAVGGPPSAYSAPAGTTAMVTAAGAEREALGGQSVEPRTRGKTTAASAPGHASTHPDGPGEAVEPSAPPMGRIK